MGDEKKTGRWARSLQKAGLIDEVEDSWNLPDDVSITKAKIIVIGDSPEKEGAEGEPVHTMPAGPPQPMDPVEQTKLKITECFEVGDYSGCLERAESFTKTHPDDEAILELIEKCRKVLMQMYESRIGSFERIPRKIIGEEELIWRNLDPLAGFIAAMVDGLVTFEDIVDISSVSRFETCRVLNQLLQDGIIQ